MQREFYAVILVRDITRDVGTGTVFAELGAQS
jgi:hypothetical protein